MTDFQHGDWRVLDAGASAWFGAPSMAAGAALAGSEHPAGPNLPVATAAGPPSNTSAAPTARADRIRKFTPLGTRDFYGRIPQPRDRSARTKNALFAGRSAIRRIM
ncbi:hypothetical protein GCM10009558_095490 [Virgisporangium aurantiacum]